MNAGLREVVLLVAGAGLVLAGLQARDPATIGLGTSLLLATPAMAARTEKATPDDEASTG